MNSKTMITDLTTGNVFKLLIKFAVPLTLANLLQLVYSIVDMVVIGRYVGSAGISAVSIGSELIMLFTSFSMGLCGAGQVIVSQYAGINDRKSISAAIGTMLPVVILFAAALSVFTLFISKWGVAVMNTPPEAVSMAEDYTMVCCAGFVFTFGYNLVSSILRGLGDAKRPLLFIAIASVLNLVLDVLFISRFNMAAKGAALATVIGQGVAFLFAITYLFIRRGTFCFDFKLSSFKIRKDILLMLIKLGLPMALQMIAVSLSSIVVSTLVNGYGLTASAVSGIGTKLRMMIALVTGSLSTAGSTMVGQNFSCGKYDRVSEFYKCAFLILLVVCVSLGALGILFPTQVFGIFDSNPDVLEMAPRFMVINFFTYLSFVIMVPGIAVINGIGYSFLSFVVGVVDGVVARIGLVLLLQTVFDLGVWGVWIGATSAAYVTSIITTYYYFSGRWKQRKPIIKSH